MASMNPYGGLPMAEAATMRFGANLLNPAMELMDPLNIPFSGRPTDVTRRLRAATDTLNVNAVGSGPLGVRGRYNRNAIPETSELKEAVNICESVKSVNCAAFRDPKFARNCVIAHEPGTNSKGEKQIGGFVLPEANRVTQQQLARSRGETPVYKSPIADLPAGRVSVNEETCVAMEESIQCAKQQNFSVRNCAVCQDGQGNWTRVPANAVREQGVLRIIGSGSYSFLANGTVTAKGELGTRPAEIELPADAEGQTFSLIVKGADARVAGLLAGETVNGTSSLDIAFVANYDTEAGAKPRLIGAMELGGEPLNVLRPATGKTGMNLQIYVPYTYLAKTEEAAHSCPTAPFSTKEESVRTLASDPCFTNRAAGQQSLECLQGRFVAAGCTAAGRGYPRDEASATQLRMVNGQPQTLTAITQRVYNASIEAATGRRINGTKLSVDEWDQVSQFCTGRKISTPCDGYDKEKGPLGDECIKYLFENGGKGKDEGPTYTLTNEYESLRGRMPQQCVAGGTASPYSAAGMEAAKRQGGVEAVKRYFDGIHRRANNNGLKDAERSEAVKQCYGVQFAPDMRSANDERSMTDKQFYSYKSPSGNSYMRHAFYWLWNHPEDSSDLYKQDATFKSAHPTCGLPGMVSLEATNFPNYYVSVEKGRGKIKERDGTGEFDNQACWREIQGKCANNGVMFENNAFPGQMLVRQNNQVTVRSVDDSTAQNACWTRTGPLAQPQRR